MSDMFNVTYRHLTYKLLTQEELQKYIIPCSKLIVQLWKHVLFCGFNTMLNAHKVKIEAAQYLLHDPDIQTYVAIDNTIDHVIGLLIGHIKWKLTYWIMILYVDPEYRQQGIGNMLMLMAEEYAKSQSCKVVSLEVNVENATAIEFYVNHSMITDKLVMTKPV